MNKSSDVFSRRLCIETEPAKGYIFGAPCRYWRYSRRRVTTRWAVTAARTCSSARTSHRTSFSLWPARNTDERWRSLNGKWWVIAHHFTLCNSLRCFSYVGVVCAAELSAFTYTDSASRSV